MTIETCISFLEKSKRQMEDPINEDGTPLKTIEYKGKEAHIKSVKGQAKANYEMMKKHILSTKKFKDHPIIAELTEKPKEEKVIKKSKKKES